METIINTHTLINELYQNHINNIHKYPIGTDLLVMGDRTGNNSKWIKATIGRFPSNIAITHENTLVLNTYTNGIHMCGIVDIYSIISLPYCNNEYLENTNIIPIPNDTPVKVQFYNSDRTYIRVFSHVEVDDDGNCHYYVHEEDGTFEECKTVSYMIKNSIHNHNYNTFKTPNTTNNSNVWIHNNFKPNTDGFQEFADEHN